MARRKHVTYDSKETFTVLGLLSLLIGIFFFISLFSITENEDNLFTQARGLFGSSTIFASIFFACLGLHFLGSRFSITSTQSLIAQAALVILIPAFMTSIATGTRELNRGETGIGGQVGYFVVQNVFGETIPTEPSTKLILFIALLIFVPLALSLSLSEIINKLGIMISWIVKLIQASTKKRPEEKVAIEKASTFGDFNTLLRQKKESQEESKYNKENRRESMSDFAASKMRLPLKKSDKNVAITEKEIGEDGLTQEQLKYPSWQLPPISLLIPFRRAKAQEPAIDQNARVIEQILSSFDIQAKVEDAFIGPSVVQYALNIPLGIKVAKVATLGENLALALGVDSKAVRIESIPDTTYLGIEIPRSKRDMVRIKELMESEEKRNSTFALPIPIGKDINGKPVIADIQKMPHLLIAGATGSGKSVLTNTFITSMIMSKTPDELKLLLVDPKRVEFSDYNGIAHLLTPVITDMEKVLNALKWAVGEMDRRYIEFEREQVKDIKSYNNKKGFSAMPYIVIVIDEMADLMMTANRVETETAIVRLAQKARAVGIHLILATQRPSVNVITGIIKANIPGRVGMSVTSSMDSRVILDRIGAESLMGNGDLLYKAPDKTKSIRLQGPYVDQEEVIRVVDFIKSQAPEVEYVPEILEKHTIGSDENGIGGMSEVSEDNMMEQAIRIVVQSQKGSSSFLQRRLNIGFNRAARLLEELEELGVVGPQNGSKPREVLISDADSFIQSLKGQG